MASLLVGRSVGVAPGAALHYFALDFVARPTPERLAVAIDHVVDRNDTLRPDERVRLLSSRAFWLWVRMLSMGYCHRHGWWNWRVR